MLSQSASETKHLYFSHTGYNQDMFFWLFFPLPTSSKISHWGPLLQISSCMKESVVCSEICSSPINRGKKYHLRWSFSKLTVPGYHYDGSLWTWYQAPRTVNEPPNLSISCHSSYRKHEIWYILLQSPTMTIDQEKHLISRVCPLLLFREKQVNQHSSFWIALQYLIHSILPDIFVLSPKRFQG